MNKNKKRAISLSKLFKNNKFLLAMSLVISIVLWVAVSLSDTNDTTATISNIPIQVTLSEEAVDSGLQIFSGNDQTASVTVTGNRLAVGSLSSDDIVVSAPTAGTISTSGNYALSLTAKKLNTSDRFEIISTVSPSVINVYVDQLKEQSFNVINKITYNVSEGYHATVSSSTSSVTVSGPQSEVDRVTSVGIIGEIEGELKDNTSLECEVKLYDNTGSVVNSNLITLSDEKIVANFSVLPYKEVPVNVVFDNKPDELDMANYTTVVPNKLKIAAPKNVLDKLDSIDTAPISMSSLENDSYNLERELEIPSKCTNISNTDSAQVKVNLSSMSSKTFKVTRSSFNVVNLDDSYSYSIATETLNVTLIGPESDLGRITSSDISCVIDASNIDGTTGSITLPATFSVNYSSSCWAHGDYKVNISVSKQ